MLQLPIGDMENGELIKLIRNPDLLNGKTLPRVKELVNLNPLFQTGWILLLRNLRNIDSPEFDEYLRRAAPRIANRKVLFQYLHPRQFSCGNDKKVKHQINFNSSKEFNLDLLSDVDNVKNSVNQQSEIIDEFLKKQSFIKIQSFADNVNTIDHSVHSTSEHEDFLTETLAEIHVSQNNFLKAIETYQKLILKFPEKSIYFAARIEKIKELLNK